MDQDTKPESKNEIKIETESTQLRKTKKLSLVNVLVIVLPSLFTLIAVLLILPMILKGWQLQTIENVQSQTSITPTTTIEATITVTTSEPSITITPIIDETGTGSVVTVDLVADRNQVAKFTNTKLPDDLRFNITKVPSNQTNEEYNVLYFGKLDNNNAMFMNQKWNKDDPRTEVYMQKNDGTWIIMETFSGKAVTFSDLTNKYELFRPIGSSVEVWYNPSITDVNNNFLYFNVSSTNVSDRTYFIALSRINLQKMTLEKVIMTPYNKSYLGMMHIIHNDKNYSIASIYECTQCDEAQAILSVINWENSSIKYLGEGELPGNFLIDHTNKMITYRPQVFDKWIISGGGLGLPDYAFQDEITIKLP